MTVVGITGHRPQHIPGHSFTEKQQKVKTLLKPTLQQLQTTHLITGMAAGVDMWTAEICIEEGIPFTAAIPFEGQHCIWSQDLQDHYHWLLGHAAHTITICTGKFAAWKMQRRNEYIVDNVAHIVAVWTGAPGGTANCVRYAKATNRPITTIHLD